MRPAQLSIFFGRLAADLQSGSAGAQGLSARISRAVSDSGDRKLGELLLDEEHIDATKLAARVRANPRVFGALESDVIAAAMDTQPLAHVARHAADHYDRRAQVDRAAEAAVFVPVLALCALWAVTTFLCVFVLPRFAQALGALGATKPLVTRAVLYGAVLFKVLLQPMLLSGGLLLLVLVLYWRTREGQARLGRVLLRAPWVGELFALWAAARFCTNAVLCSQFGSDAADAVRRAAAAVPCEPLRAAVAARDKPAAEGPFVSLLSALEGACAAGALVPALLAEADLLEQRLALLSRQMVLASQALLAAFTVGLCIVVVCATYLPVARFHDAVIR